MGEGPVDRTAPARPRRRPGAGPPPAPGPDVTASDTDDGRTRCAWATGPWLTPYHDVEWGVLTHDVRQHFEHLILEGAQAGLSWLTVLKRRDGYRKAFAGFDPETVAGFGPADIARLLEDPGIIRNRAKVESAVRNAAVFLEIQAEHGSFDDYLWAHVTAHHGSCPVVNHWEGIGQLPATSPMAEALSKDLRRRGMRFVGPIVCYSHLQSVGLINDHLVTCFRYDEINSAGATRTKRAPATNPRARASARAGRN